MGVLVWQGNPPNMGLCGACFLRDTAGALGLHQAAPVKYLRPEIAGVILGALASALFAREFHPRGGGAPLLKVLLGIWVSIGALVFLGCPFRMLQRLGGGDANGLLGLGGLAVGIGFALTLMRRGFTPGRSAPLSPVLGLLIPAMALGLLAALLVPLPGVSASESGPGAQHAPWWVSLGAAFVAGVLLQRARFCTLAFVRHAVFSRDLPAALPGATLILSYAAGSAILGTFKPGFEGQPIAHTDALWNTLAMLLVGLAGSMAGGCPVRQMILSGEGDSDAGCVLIGMLAGGALAHTLGLASTPAGPSAAGRVAVVAGIVFCLVVGLFARSAGEPVPTEPVAT
ncbi:MAG: YedE-related selenium metabolism membrane protein [Planctomycetes bacterium]|nr:YedE-related selenium metabolism membrane protein [Planctomycetota bacterium]